MSYPPPSEFDSPPRLYKQAMFFYKEYERMKKQLAKKYKPKCKGCWIFDTFLRPAKYTCERK
jgi:hypothetical protein